MPGHFSVSLLCSLDDITSHLHLRASTLHRSSSPLDTRRHMCASTSCPFSFCFITAWARWILVFSKLDVNTIRVVR
ncbi:hypothetical protein SERLA73DRAFT_174858 [Serpula lacrymans var. lacrymans S7.3]|uniref:Uncharacterized protein n=1 Tax=Serpula lacrymans var. lacrymans (strain S7.3) TaxID=936435 RepID=F8PIL9_SERL3|nr:hypothetical protein SERLA73DRAFT_174858 [Serpula lacrymans var. lacrymans S7.3]